LDGKEFCIYLRRNKLEASLSGTMIVENPFKPRIYIYGRHKSTELRAPPDILP
jgi:hypothetical protein